MTAKEINESPSSWQSWLLSAEATRMPKNNKYPNRSGVPKYMVMAGISDEQQWQKVRLGSAGEWKKDLSEKCGPWVSLAFANCEA